MKINTAEFIKSCQKVSQFPSYNFPEFAFIGRSNVGKSSLINMVVGRKNLVKTGSKPGVTRTINFFTINDTISLADLPGFGYAKVSKEVKKAFIPLINSYLTNRDNLRMVFLLMDIRRKPADMEFELLEKCTENRIPVALTLTKCDKLSGNERTSALKLYEDLLEIERHSFFLTSAKSSLGKKDLLEAIRSHLK